MAVWKSRVVRTPAKTKTPRPRPKAKAAPTRPLLTRAEVRRAVSELASRLAPGDLDDLLADEDGLRKRAGMLDGAAGAQLRAQLDLALRCLRDHVDGECPQVPFFTISMLAAGVAYLADELDLVPDFIPGKGTLDDALVMALAMRMAAAGVRRYCTAKGIAADAALGAARG